MSLTHPDTEMLFFVFQISPASFGQDSTTRGEIFSRDCLGRATWVKIITRNKTPANRRKSPSMPRWSIRNGFNFDKRNVEDISNVIRIPTAVDLETILFSSGTFLQLPDIHRYALSGDQAGNDTKSKAIANVSKDDHGHRDEVEVAIQVKSCTQTNR